MFTCAQGPRWGSSATILGGGGAAVVRFAVVSLCGPAGVQRRGEVDEVERLPVEAANQAQLFTAAVGLFRRCRDDDRAAQQCRRRTLAVAGDVEDVRLRKEQSEKHGRD